MKSILRLMGILAVIVGIAIYAAPQDARFAHIKKGERTAEPKPDKEWITDVLVMRALRDSMHDPRSFEVVQVLRMQDRTLCVTYRARNAFNALRQGQAVVTQHTAAVTGQPQFTSLWNRHCGGKQGEDISHIRHAM